MSNGPSNGRDRNSLLGPTLLGTVERGWVPDMLVRVGIRQLLKSRLRELEPHQGQADTEQFLKATQAQPIAVNTLKANEQHYEVPAEFFKLVLGHRLKYSCCYWGDGVTTLDEAEDESLRITCEHAGIEDGMSVLELGCGWGSLSLWMAEHFPTSSITAVSNSHSQRRFIEHRAQALGLNNLTVTTADMNEFQPSETFDRVVSVEMFEHMRNHRLLLDRIYDWLNPAGQLLVHVFCHRETPYLFRSDGAYDWMGRNFFSGGMMPSVDLLERTGARLLPQQRWTWNGNHYAKTCRAWLDKQDRQAAALSKVLRSTYGHEGERWHHRWRLFFMACEELFAFREGSEWFVSHYLFSR